MKRAKCSNSVTALLLSYPRDPLVPALFTPKPVQDVAGAVIKEDVGDVKEEAAPGAEEAAEAGAPAAMAPAAAADTKPVSLVSSSGLTQGPSGDMQEIIHIPSCEALLFFPGHLTLLKIMHSPTDIPKIFSHSSKIKPTSASESSRETGKYLSPF